MQKLNQQAAILVASFGTIHQKMCSRSIDCIRSDFSECFGNERVFEGWTGLGVAEQAKKANFCEALEQIRQAGFQEVFVQPTHLMKGKEYEKIIAWCEARKNDFANILIGNPLVSDDESIRWMADYLTNKYRPETGIDEKAKLVLVGHGSSHLENRIYRGIQQELQRNGCNDILIGTVEGTPTISDVLRELKAMSVEEVVLAPFLLTAGTHATKDLCGEQEDSWYSILSRNGYHVTTNTIGLGELKTIRQRYINLLVQIMEKR